MISGKKQAGQEIFRQNNLEIGVLYEIFLWSQYYHNSILRGVDFKVPVIYKFINDNTSIITYLSIFMETVDLIFLY